MSTPTPVLPRRTFAIISHPDAGKTTLTEKLLLYGGALDLAGTVTARKNQRSTTSDWMELEKQRGISISSTVLQFDYSGFRINLLDTPGHNDFSEDTYRVLTAVDAAIMVIDAGKGIEAQTRKLFEVCRRRGVPIFTFMNKCDRPTREPLDLIDELERALGIAPFPINWPLGDGPKFRGVYDRLAKQVHLFERTRMNAFVAPVSVHGIDDPSVAAQVDPEVYAKGRDEIELLGGLGDSFDPARVHAGELTPVYFGSAMNNFGVQLLLDGFLRDSLGPGPRRSGDRLIQPTDPAFSGFVFKIQANMDPRHRDRIAFVRVVSGTFEREMTVTHVQGDRKIKLNNAQRLFGRDRETVEDGHAGDVVGLVGHDALGIGDTISTDRTIRFNEMPTFVPEIFSYIHNPSPGNAKKYSLGVKQLLQEGVVREFTLLSGPDGMVRRPILAAVGPLQFEVLQARLESEYNAECRIEPTRWKVARWWRKEGAPADWKPEVLSDATLCEDHEGRSMILFPDEWPMRYFQQKNQGIELSTVPFTGR
jgi:peptide chain release factor 3